MAGSLSQDERIGKFTSPFAGEEELALERMTGFEGLSDLFEFHVSALSKKENLDFKKALGKTCCVEFKAANGASRFFNGLLTEAHWAGGYQDLFRYELVLRPWLWFLTRTSNSRIFKNQNAIEIVQQVFQDNGFNDFNDKTLSKPPKIEYCVQYRETDFNFVSRMLELYGIYYFFKHEQGKHTLILADSKSSHEAIKELKPASNDVPGGAGVLIFNPNVGGGRRKMQYAEDWSRGRRAQTGKFTLNDYEYRKPTTQLLAESEKPGGYEHDKMEMYDFPGPYPNEPGDGPMTVSVGEKLAKVRVEAAQSLDERRACGGMAPSLFPGGLVTLQKVGIPGEDQEYLVTYSSHVINAQSYRSRSSGGLEEAYSGNYELTPSSRQFRAQVVTHKPSISGPQSALVVGKEGEEIDVDELGRILVQFYWDRKKQQSRRVRVAQIWAGSARGALFLPRIGDEVLIAFEEGDPDRPIVVGSVYNKKNTVPMTLPGKKVKSGLLTKSSKGGGGYNMLLFDDTKGEENVKLRSQKDLKFKALHDQEIKIGNDRTDKVGNNVKQEIGNNQSVKVGNNKDETIGQAYSNTAGTKITLTVGGSTVTMDPSSITIKSPTITIQGDALVSISAPMVKINS